jgi:hypothetical protein
MAAIRDEQSLLDLVRAIHERIRARVLAAAGAGTAEALSAVAGHHAGDTIYAVDRLTEDALVEGFAELAREWPCLLVAEGLGTDGRALLPAGTPADRVEIVVIVDPIDGTRGFMYGKRPAWILTGVAPLPPGGRPPTLADIRLAVQTEIPLAKQHLADTVWAVAGAGVAAERWDRISGARQPLALRPSQAPDLAHGFASLAKFFPGTRAELAAIDDALVARLLGPPPPGAALVFDDQYLCSGGQLYELASGHDRFVADLRPLLAPVMRARGDNPALCAHPYDLCTELCAREAGVVVTDPAGRPLAAPLDVDSDVAWVGYANRRLADTVGPALRAELAARGLAA